MLTNREKELLTQTLNHIEERQKILDCKTQGSVNREIFPLLPEGEINLERLSLRNEDHLQTAVDLVERYHTIGIQFMTLGLLCRADDPRMVAKTFKCKGTPEDSEKPITLAVPNLNELVNAVDIDQIPREVRYLFESSQVHTLEKRLGGIAISLWPLRADVDQLFGKKLHTRVTSRDSNGAIWVQVLYFGENQRHANRFINIVSQKVGLVGVTSLNNSGEPTVTDINRAIEMAKKWKLGAFLYDPLVSTNGIYKRVQSYPIIKFTSDGLMINRSENMNLAEQHIKDLWPELFAQSAENIASYPPEIYNLALGTKNPSNVYKRYATYAAKPKSAQISS